jgi:hypothetical protein
MSPDWIKRTYPYTNGHYIVWLLQDDLDIPVRIPMVVDHHMTSSYIEIPYHNLQNIETMVAMARIHHLDKEPTKRVGLVQNGHHYLIECNLYMLCYFYSNLKGAKLDANPSLSFDSPGVQTSDIPHSRQAPYP